MPKPALVVTVPAAQAPSDARRALAAAISRKADADAAMQRTTAAVTAVSRLVNAEATARKSLDEANARAADAIADWAQNGATGEPDTVDSLVMVTLNHDLAMATATATAARASLPRLEAEHQTTRSAVAAARVGIEEAMRNVLADEAAAIDAEIAALFDRVTALRTRLYGLGNHVQRMQGANALVNGIRRLVERFIPDPTNAAVVASQDRWRAFAERLTTDPDATIEAE
jgi:phage-related protein